MIETVVDIIESEDLLANVRALSQQIRETCVVGPVVGTQGAGFLLGLRTRRPARDVQQELLAARHPDRHQRRPARRSHPGAVRARVAARRRPAHGARGPARITAIN